MVVTGGAAQGVGGAVASQHVVERVAGSIHSHVAGQGEVFYVGGQCPADGAQDGICAGIGSFYGGVARAHHVDVVACACGEDVGGAVAGQRVVQFVAGGVDGGGAGEGEVFHFCAEGETNACKHRVNTCPLELKHHITEIVDDIGVVAEIPIQVVRPRTSVQHVVGVVAGDRVVQRVACSADPQRTRVVRVQDQILNVGTQRVTDHAHNCVRAFVRVFDHHLRRTNNHVSVVTQAATHRGVAAASAQGVIASCAQNRQWVDLRL